MMEMRFEKGEKGGGEGVAVQVEEMVTELPVPSFHFVQLSVNRISVTFRPPSLPQPEDALGRRGEAVFGAERATRTRRNKILEFHLYLSLSPLLFLFSPLPPPI